MSIKTTRLNSQIIKMDKKQNKKGKGDYNYNIYVLP